MQDTAPHCRAGFSVGLCRTSSGRSLVIVRRGRGSWAFLPFILILFFVLLAGGWVRAIPQAPGAFFCECPTRLGSVVVSRSALVLGHPSPSSLSWIRGTCVSSR